MEKMKYVQTGRWFIREPITGPDSIVNFDYMGAAEYEMTYENNDGITNPLTLSLWRMVKNKDKFDYYKLPKRKDGIGRQVYIYCKTDELEETKDAVRQLIKKEETKRYCGLKEYLKLNAQEIQSIPEYRRKDFWWDIRNDVIIFMGEESLEMCKKLIKSAEMLPIIQERLKEKSKRSFIHRLFNR